MNQSSLAPIQQQVEHNLAAGWTWCFLRPDHVKELVEGYKDAWRRMGAIHELEQKAELALADHHLYEDHDPCVKGLLREIKELAAL